MAAGRGGAPTVPVAGGQATAIAGPAVRVGATHVEGGSRTPGAGIAGTDLVARRGVLRCRLGEAPGRRVTSAARCPEVTPGHRRQIALSILRSTKT